MSLAAGGRGRISPLPALDRSPGVQFVCAPRNSLKLSLQLPKPEELTQPASPQLAVLALLQLVCSERAVEPSARNYGPSILRAEVRTPVVSRRMHAGATKEDSPDNVSGLRRQRRLPVPGSLDSVSSLAVPLGRG